VQRSGVYGGISIAGNVFHGNRGVNLQIAASTAVAVQDNVFEATFVDPVGDSGSEYNVPQTALVYVTNSSNIEFSNNAVGTLGQYGKACLQSDPSNVNVTVLPGGLTCTPLASDYRYWQAVLPVAQGSRQAKSIEAA
jgi:hypothetical protein